MAGVADADVAVPGEEGGAGEDPSERLSVEDDAFVRETLFRVRDISAGLMWDTALEFTKSHGGAFDAWREGSKTDRHEGGRKAQDDVHGKMQFRRYPGVEEKLKTHQKTRLEPCKSQERCR